jgi:hypothetical protein
VGALRNIILKMESEFNDGGIEFTRKRILLKAWMDSFDNGPEPWKVLTNLSRIPGLPATTESPLCMIFGERVSR